MAAAVMTPQTISFAREAEIMAPSPLSKTGASPRHGRTKSGGRTRGYSIHVVSEREAAISKALAKVFRQARAHASEKEDSSSEEEDAVTIDAEGWANCEEVLNSLSSLAITVPEMHDLISAPASKFRYQLKTKPSAPSTSESPSDYQIRPKPSQTHTYASKNAPITIDPATLTPVTPDNVPELAVYGLSYATYTLVLAAGGIKKAGGQTYISCREAALSAPGSDDEGNAVSAGMAALSMGGKKAEAEVVIYLGVLGMLEAGMKGKWFKGTNGVLLCTADVIESKFWKKAVGRRADVGVLFEEGAVVKELPVGLRGKGGKNLKGKGGKKAQGRVVAAVKEVEGQDDDE